MVQLQLVPNQSRVYGKVKRGQYRSIANTIVNILVPLTVRIKNVLTIDKKTDFATDLGISLKTLIC